MSEQQPWSQLVNEPDLWHGRFLAFLRMGTRRTVAAVYRKEHHVKPRQTTLKIPGDWYEIEKLWKWGERAKAYDEAIRAEEDQIIRDEREKVLRSGFALMHKRVKELDSLTRKLVKMTNDESKVWIPETRTFGSGEEVTVVEKVEFNAPLFTLIDKYLASIAAELGERVKKSEINAKVEATGDIAVYLPQKHDLKGGDSSANSDTADKA